jgi:protein arginine kinase activator
LFDSGFIGILLNNDLIKTVDKNECPQCKSTLTSIKQQGKVGCPMCYMTFESYFDSLLEQVHGKKTHQGKKPNKQHNSIKDLKNKLQEAIKNEKYEDAAVLRDAINRLEENSHQQTQNPKTSSS